MHQITRLEVLERGFLDVSDDISFPNHHEVCHLFGDNGILRLPPVVKHPFEPDKHIWFAQFFENGVWENAFRNNEKTMLERRIKNNDGYVVQALADPTKYKRLLFAKVIDPDNRKVYRFKGFYELDAQTSRRTNVITYRRVSEQARTYPNLEFEALLAKRPTTGEIRYFTHYWQNTTWEANRLRNAPGTPLSHVSGHQFKARGIGSGDVVYVVTNKEGKLFLCGRMVVGAYCSKAEAARITATKESEIFDASEHIVGFKGTPMEWDLEVPLEMTKRLLFVHKTVLSPLKFNPSGRLDKQTLRPVRMLTKNSAMLLDTMLETNQPIELFNEEFETLWEEKSSRSLDEPNSDYESLVEGNKKLRYVTYYERNVENRKAAIKIHGYDCQGCGINFERKYGLHGRGYIHVHHLKPVSQFEKPKRINPKSDLSVLCPNCHAMVHKKKIETLSIEQLRELIRSASSGGLQN